MSSDLIVSYDGTPNDDDALALGKMLARSGATIALAYVRHAREFDPAREEIAQHDAERRLEHGRSWLRDPNIPGHVVIAASTAEGLMQLAQAESASMVVFGSDYRTPPGHVEPGTAAQHMLEGGTVAIAVAAAGLRTKNAAQIKSIAVLAADGVGPAQATAESLAGKLGASVVATDAPEIDLIVVGSQPTAQPGRIALSGSTRSLLNSIHGSVLVVPHGQPVEP